MYSVPLQSYTKSFEWTSQSTLHYFQHSISQILMHSVVLRAAVTSCCCICVLYTAHVNMEAGSDVHWGGYFCHLHVILVLQLSLERVLLPPRYLQVWGSSQSILEEGSSNSPYKWSVFPLQACIGLPCVHTSSSRQVIFSLPSAPP